MKDVKSLKFLTLIMGLMIVMDYALYINIITYSFYLLFVTIIIVFLFMCIIGKAIGKKSEKKKTEIETLLYYDEVTELPNKNKFLLELEKINKKKEKYCVVTLDMKNFKSFVDLNGITETNKFLKFIGDNLKKEIKNNEICAHINDDNFALVLKYDNNNQTIERIERINKNINNYSKNLKITLSFGIYIINDKRYSPTLMLNKANVSRKAVTDKYDTLYAFYDEKLKNDNLELADIENYMEQSFQEKHFIIYFQPKYSIHNNKLNGLEALVRWLHPKKGILFPDKFIPQFEKNNFIMKLDLYILEEVCKVMNKWEKNKIPIVPVSINLSRANLNNQNLIKEIQKIVKKYNIQPKYIEFEFTENVIFDNMQVFLSVIKQMHQIGYKVSIDDFGAGHSSLNVLKKLPVDVLKIDKEFLNENNKKGEIIISNTINMAKELKIKVLVEGIETNEQVQFLKSIKCDYGQGYYFSKPLPLKETEILLKK